MKYTVWLFDGTYHVVKNESYPNGIADVEDAMARKTPVDLSGTLVAGSAISKIEKFGNVEYGNYGLSLGVGTFERAAELMEGRPKKPSEHERIVSEIKDKLRKIGGSDAEKREYVATQRLARKLHDTSNWKVKEWEDFAAAHKDPLGELADLEGKES